MYPGLKDEPIKQRWLDFSECKHPLELHNIIREKLELPEGYGCNLDALWDSITGMMYVPAEVTIVYRPEKNSQWVREYVEEVVSIFQEAREQYDEIIVQVVME